MSSSLSVCGDCRLAAVEPELLMKRFYHKRRKDSPATAAGRALLLAGCLLLPQAGFAFHLPLWEAGAGLGVLNVPHYRGSKTEADLAIPFPYIIYRGDVLRVDQEDGIRGKMFESDNVTIDLSLAGSIPVPDTDDDDDARSGMPGLDPLVEAGAEVTFGLWQSASAIHSFQFVVPYRFVYSVGDPLLEYQGWTLSPYINYRIRFLAANALTRYNLSFGPIYADEDYHEYFYEVEPEYVTPQREAYEAERGYSGSRITLSFSRNTGKFLLGAFARYDNLDGAVFEDSPLIETTDYFAVGFALSWIFGKSEKVVSHEKHDH